MAGLLVESDDAVAVDKSHRVAAVPSVAVESTEEASRPLPTDVHPLPVPSNGTQEGLLEVAVASRSTDLVAPEFHTVKSRALWTLVGCTSSPTLQ